MILTLNRRLFTKEKLSIERKRSCVLTLSSLLWGWLIENDLNVRRIGLSRYIKIRCMAYLHNSICVVATNLLTTQTVLSAIVWLYLREERGKQSMVAVAARYLDEGNVFDPLMIIAGQNISWSHIMNVFIVSVSSKRHKELYSIRLCPASGRILLNFVVWLFSFH